jgi:hypothetical protein
VIHGAVIHLLNEQPLLADLQGLPEPADTCLICTNLRLVDGKPVTFIDRAGNWFVIPLGQVRFVEMPASALSDEGLVAPHEGETTSEEIGPDLELDEDLLRRIRET